MVLAGVIILLGGWLRFCGLDWGLPFLYDPDEPQFASRALAMVAHGKMDPEWYGHPGSTTMYLMALVCGLSTLVGLATGKYESLEAARTIMEYDPSDFYYLGRLVILVFSVGTLILFYKLARRLTGGWTSVLALALLAVFPIHVSISRLIRTDIQATFFILLSLWYCVSIVEHNRLRDYLWAGFFLGLAVVTKYPAAVFSLTVMTAFLLAQVGQPREPVNRFGYLLAGGVSGLVGVVVGSPLLFFRFSQVLHDVGFESRSYHLSATSHGFFDSAHWYLSGPLAAGVTWAGLVLAFHAAVVIVGTRNSRQLLILVSTAAFLVFLSAMKLRWARWVVPLTPLVSLLAAIGFSCFWSWVTTRSRSKWVAGSLVGLALVWTAVPAYDGYLRARALDQASTQTLAWEWIMQNVPPGRSVLQERYTPQLPPDRYDLYWVPEGQIVPMELKSRYVIPQGVIGSLGDVAWIQETGVDYILLGSDYDRRLVEADRYGAEIAVYRYIMERCRLVYEAWPEVGRIDGGPVRIYQVRKARSAGGSPGSGY
jgi:4-amino-4-deoxy-L-arabinose transferase-like glycosyltransferase